MKEGFDPFPPEAGERPFFLSASDSKYCKKYNERIGNCSAA